MLRSRRRSLLQRPTVTMRMVAAAAAATTVPDVKGHRRLGATMLRMTDVENGRFEASWGHGRTCEKFVLYNLGRTG